VEKQLRAAQKEAESHLKEAQRFEAELASYKVGPKSFKQLS
jgi:hypothetical protein